MRRLRFAAMALSAALALLAPSPAGASPSALAAAIGARMDAAGGASGAYVLDLSTGRTLFARLPDVRRLPASVEKIYTVGAALLKLGEGARFSTDILGSGSADESGVFTGTLYLRGGGDPTLGTSAFDRSAYGAGQGSRLEDLVTALLDRTQITALRGQIVADESVLDSRRGTPFYGFAPAQDMTGELSGLAFDRGFANFQGTAYVGDPPRAAGIGLVTALRAAHVEVPHGFQIAAGPTPPAAQLLASLPSPSLATLARLTMLPSDNFLAETLLKDLGARRAGAGSTAAGANVVSRALATLAGIHPRIEDGSGLSRRDLTSPRDVVKALAALRRLPPFIAALPVAGRSGTLAHRMRGTAAAGRCRAKTGTLNDVSNLAGYCLARNGHLLAFALLMNGVYAGDVHSMQDAIAVALARYAG